MRGRGLALLLLLANPAAAQPARVVSLNLCTDQLLLALAAPGQIAALSSLASDCTYSNACAEARHHPATRGAAEEIVALHPDLVLAGRYTTRPAVEAARRLGIPVLDVDPVDTLAGIPAQIAQVAAAIGRPEQGAALAAAFGRRLAAIPPPGGHHPVAAIYQPNGFTTGPGSLAADVLRRAGLTLFAGPGGAGTLPMEVLVWRHPDLLVTGEPAASSAQATAMLDHPLLTEAFAGRRVAIPGRLLLCGLPQTLDAVEALARAAQP